MITGVEIFNNKIHCSEIQFIKFRTYDFNADRVPGPYLLVAPVDNFTGEPLHVDIDGFNEQGQAYRIEKSQD